MPYTQVQTDDANAFDWSEIRTTYDDFDVITKVQTIYDDGIDESAYYTDGVLDSVITLDTAGTLHPWDRINETYDAQGLLTGRTTFYDDGSPTKFESFTGGVLSLVQYTDSTTASQESWWRIMEDYNAAGDMTRRTTTYDDASRKIEYFADGLRYNVTLQDASADGGFKSYDYTQTTYDPATGVIESRFTVYDNGMQRSESYTDGQRTGRLDQDLGNAKSWDAIETIYSLDGSGDTRFTIFDDGVEMNEVTLSDGRFMMVDKTDVNDTQSWTRIDQYFNEGVQLQITRVTQYDDGVTREESWVDGNRSFTREQDGFENARSWETIDRYYEIDGTIAAIVTTFDNGVTREQTFQNGVIAQIVETDPLGAKSFSSKTTYFDNGVIAARETVANDEVRTTENFEAGVIAQTTVTDVMNSRSFESIETYYQNGMMVARINTADTGVVTTDTYENGVRIQREQQDTFNQTSWQDITSYYDANGDLIAKVSNYDSGVARTETFENGVRIQVEETDPLNQKNWSSINDYYDPSQDVRNKITVYDSGVERLDVWEGGVYLGNQKQDLTNAFAWNVQETAFNIATGETIRSTLYDSGDKLVDVLVDGVLQQRLQNDGDSSNTWQVRVTDYPTDGAPVITTYDTYEETPAQVLEYLNLGAMSA